MENQSINLFSEQFSSFFSGLFARQEFTAAILEKSFGQTFGWIEIIAVCTLMFTTYWLSKQLLIHYRNTHTIRFPILFHICSRLLWPSLLLIATIIALYFWQLTDHKPVWLHLLAMASRWMILIRLILAIIHAALPSHRFTDWLERTSSLLLWIAFCLWISGIDDIIINTLKNLTIPLGSTQLSVYTLLTGMLWIGIIVMFTLWLARFINGRLMSSLHLDINLRIMLGKIITTLLVIVSILIALPLIGIDLTVLSVFGGALGVGIGLSLQKVASNYISGFIILGDRSIRPGDRLTVDNFTGYVKKITSRFVVLKSIGGTEALIPNETFVTSTVINESYTEKSLWQSLQVQVAYQTDLHLALNILENACSKQERVMNEPAPKAFLENFGDNGIDLSVGFWVADPENGFRGLFSDILLDIWQQFNHHGIEFPFPQREIRILKDEDTPTAETEQVSP